MSIQPFLIGSGWMEMRDGDDSCRAIFERHYSRYIYADGRKSKLFVGPGGKRVLMRADGSALFAWRKFKSDAGEMGVNCAIFRNEGDELASALILEAESFARDKWPTETRYYTYINPAEVKPTMFRGFPVWGWCFYKAGWKYHGVSKSGKIILDKLVSPSPTESEGA